MKTEKYNKMISAFACDFDLAKNNKIPLAQLDYQLKINDTNLYADIELLKELDCLLRIGHATINVTEDD